jgi:LPS sulfotransferase NodH
VKWRQPAASINPFGPPPQPWECGHYRFRFAYDHARMIFQANDAIEAFADTEGTDPARIAPDLFAAAVSAAAHHLRDAIPLDDIPAAARAAVLIAWYDALADHADRVRHP